MASSTSLMKHSSTRFLLRMLVLITIVCNTLVFDASAASLELGATGVSESPSADFRVSSTAGASRKVLYSQYTLLDKTYWRTLEDQTSLLDKWFGRPITSSTIGEDKTMGDSSKSDYVGLYTPPYMNFIYISPQRANAGVHSSPALTMQKRENLATDETSQRHIAVGLKDVVRRAQTQSTTTSRSSDIDNFQRTNQDILENSIVAPLRLHPPPHLKLNTLRQLEKDVYKAPTHHKVQLHAQREPKRFFANSKVQETIIATNEYNTMIPLTMYDTGTTVISFKGHKDHIVNVVLQLRGERYESSGLDYNCENTRISAQLRSSASLVNRGYQKSASELSSTMAAHSDLHDFGGLGDTLAGRENDGNRDKGVVKIQRDDTLSAKAHVLEDVYDFVEPYEGNQNSVWSSFAQLFDTSLLCEVLPSLSIRVPMVGEEREFNFIIQSNVHPLFQSKFINNQNFLEPNPGCSMRVYISQTPAKRLEVNQIIFAVVIPLLVLLIPLPFFLRRADIIQVASLGIDVVDCIWYPPYLLRKIVILGALRLKSAVQAAWNQRKRKAQQKRLEMQQRALSARMNAAMLVAQSQSCGEGTRPAKGVDIPLGLPVQPQQAGILSSSSALAAADVTVTGDESKASEDGKEDYSASLGELPKRKPVGDDKDFRNPLCTSMATAEPATAVVVVKTDFHRITEETPPSRFHRECGKVYDAGGNPPFSASHGKRGIDGDAVTRQESTVPCTTDDNGPTSRELLFATDPCGEGDSGEEDERFCRICRDGDEDEALVAPCKCTGSVRWVHTSCLDHWRIESIKRNMNNVNTCEICKSPFRIKIRRSILIWQTCKSMVYATILIFSCLICFILVPLIIYGVFGEISCVAEYHSVPYTTIFKLDGLMLSFFIYIEIILAVIFARLIVYSWFRSSPEVEAYVAEVHVVPRFMTWLNILKIAFVTMVLIAQAISVGYLVKYFMYATSYIVWNWEASPLLGGIIFVVFIFSAIGMSASLREQWMQSRIAQGRAEVTNVVAEDLNSNNSPRVNHRAEGTRVVVNRVGFGFSSASQREEVREQEPGR